jgi:hypothetical protein
MRPNVRADEIHLSPSAHRSQSKPSTASELAIDKLEEPYSIFIHYTISEDRSGDPESITRTLLARLGSRSKDELPPEKPERLLGLQAGLETRSSNSSRNTNSDRAGAAFSGSDERLSDYLIKVREKRLVLVPQFNDPTGGPFSQNTPTTSQATRTESIGFDGQQPVDWSGDSVAPD